MRNHRRRLLPLLAVLAVLVLAMSATAFAAGEDPTEEPGSKMMRVRIVTAPGYA